MAADIEMMVRDLYRSVDADQGRISADDVVSRTVVGAKPVANPPRRLQTMGWAVVTAAVAVVLVVGATTLFAVSGGGPDVSNSPSVPDVTPTTTVQSVTTTSIGNDDPVSDITAPFPIDVADEPGDTITFKGRTFRIRDSGLHYRIDELRDDHWSLRDEWLYDFPPTLTATQDQIMAVSPSPGTGSRVCREYVVLVAVSDTGEDWHHTAIDDMGDDIRGQETRPERRNFPCMNLGGGGDAIGPAGMLIVRVVTRCCVDPYYYPHFWFSPNGVDWQRVQLPDEMTDIRAEEWGAPSATPDGFTIDVKYGTEGDPNDSGPILTRWVTTDGTNWTKSGSS
jgi:hypothetical protein